MPRRNQENGTSTWSVALIILLVLIILILLYPTIMQLMPLITTPMVNVSGHVTTAGFTAAPSRVAFAGGGGRSTAAVGDHGSYSIMLQNGHEYNITVAWTAAGGLASGNCTAGSIDLHSSTAKLTYNISC